MSVQDINTHVDADLDDIEAKLVRTPDFFFTRRGTLDEVEVHQRIRVTDPNLVDWRILVQIEENAELLGHIIPDEDDKRFLRENPIPIVVLGKLLNLLQEHFGLPEIGGAAKKSFPI